MISEKHDFTVLGGLRHNKLVIFFKEEKGNIPVVELGKMFTVFKSIVFIEAIYWHPE